MTGSPLGRFRFLQMLQLEMQTFLLGLSGHCGRYGLCWPNPGQYSFGVAISQRLSFLWFPPGKVFQLRKLGRASNEALVS